VAKDIFSRRFYQVNFWSLVADEIHFVGAGLGYCNAQTYSQKIRTADETE